MPNHSQPQKTTTLLAFALLATAILPAAAHAQTPPNPYPAPAPVEQYLIADKDAEIALARTAAPPSVSAQAEILVLGRDGYTTAVKGTNDFTCLVERGFAANTDDSVFWNPKNEQFVIHVLVYRKITSSRRRGEVAENELSGTNWL